MKKLFYYSIALLAAVSCAKEIAPDNNVEAPKGDLKTYTIGASIDNSTIAPQDLTKANLDAETLEVLWQSKDTIGLVTADGAITPAWLAEGYGGKTEGVFNYQAESEIEPVYAYYPYTSSSNVCQQSVEGGKLNISLLASQNRVKSGMIRQNTLIMVARAGGDNVVFKNTCAIAKISVKGKSVVTRNLYVNTPWAALNGAGTVDMTSDNPVFVTNPIDELSQSTSNKIAVRTTLLAIRADQVTTITPESNSYVLAGYLVLPAGTYHSLSFETLSTEGDNSTYIQSYSPVTDITLNVGKIRPLNVPIDVPTEFTDLSADGKIANCYMIQGESEENFGFRLATRAYSGGKGTNTDLTITNAYNATVLWQSTEGLISSVTYNRANAMIYFKRDINKTGNAVIALRTREGQVIYSWHIWVIGEQLGTNTFKDATLMDRNLGAYGNSDYTLMGTYYQWGRKDPFPGATEGTGSVKRATVYPDNAIKTLTAQDGKTLDWTKYYPNVYIWGNDNSGRQDWLADKPNNNLWYVTAVGNKTVNDPCPYGYRVPNNNEFANNAIHTSLKSSSNSGLKLVVKDTNGKDAVFPLGGLWRRKQNSSSEIANLGDIGWLWCCNGTGTLDNGAYGFTSVSISNASGGRRLYYTSAANDAGIGDGLPRRWGANVRCVKFTEVDAE